MKHAAVLRPVVARAQQCPEHYVASMHLERKQGIIDRPVEAKACNDSSQISSSPNKGRHHGELRPVHERHDAVAGSLCHLDKQGEAHKHGQGHVPRLGVVHQAEAKEEDCFKEEGQELRPDAAAESHVLEEDVAGDSTKDLAKRFIIESLLTLDFNH